MKLSVVIPTHNRAEILKICLTKLSQQQGVDFEVIVVDDGSTDDTRRVVSNFQFSIFNLQKNHKFQISNFKYIHQPASHQGVARNRGLKEAKGDIIVFIGDDIFVEPGFLQKHHDRHVEFPDEKVVVLGFTTWAPSLPINSYMRFLEDSGWQFGYKFIRPGFVSHEEPYKFFYTSNISLKRSFFGKEKFDENFKVYGWEDTELGYRLWKKHQMKLYFEPSAIAFHHHLISPSDLPKKMRAVGKSAVHFEQLQPEVRVIPRGLKRFVLKIAAFPYLLPIWRLFGENVYYKFKSWQEFLRGTDEHSS